MLPNLSELPLVAAVGAPDAKRPRPDSPDEEAGPSSAFAPTEGRWWPVHHDGTFQVYVSRPNGATQALRFKADPLMHTVPAKPVFDQAGYDVSPWGGPWPRYRGGNGALNDQGERAGTDYSTLLWAKVTMIEERSLGPGQPVATLYTAYPNMEDYGLPVAKADALKELRETTMEHVFGVNNTSVPRCRVPDEFHLIVTLSSPDPGKCGWCPFAIGVIPMTRGEDPLSNEQLARLLVECPFHEVQLAQELAAAN